MLNQLQANQPDDAPLPVDSNVASPSADAPVVIADGSADNSAVSTDNSALSTDSSSASSDQSVIAPAPSDDVAIVSPSGIDLGDLVVAPTPQEVNNVPAINDAILTPAPSPEPADE